MSFLDTATRVVRLVSALVWLAVGVVTLWGTWVLFRDLQPFVDSLGTVLPAGGKPGNVPVGTLPDFRQLLTPRVEPRS